MINVIDKLKYNNVKKMYENYYDYLNFFNIDKLTLRHCNKIEKVTNFKNIKILNLSECTNLSVIDKIENIGYLNLSNTKNINEINN